MSKTAYGSIMITDSTDGVNAALINLYKQGTTAPSVPSTDLVYNFQNATITGNTGGWSQTTSGFDPTITTWIITAMALSSESTDTILSGEWSVPVQVSDSSTPAQDGLNQATVFIYIRSNTTPQTPANASYTFANGAFTAPSGWSKTIPGANGKPCFVTSAVAIGRGTTATLTWATPTKLAEDGEKGEDGFSPVVTSTSTGVQIEDKDGHITYINNGTNGQTYYTHIRYSSKATPTAASDVSTSPTGKSYMGIQTTTSQTAPAWNNSGWTWVKYVGENGQPGAQGNPGAQGVSVTSVRELYYLTQGSQPSKPTSSTTIVSTDTINAWTTTLPSYVANGKYYVSLETTLSNSTKVWSNVSLDKATTDANYNAYLAMSASQHAEENAWGAISIASDTRQYFWNLPTDYSTNVKAGTYITKIPNDAFKPNPSAGGANIFMQNAGIWLRNGLDNLATLQGTGLYLYVPEGTYKGKKGMSLTKDALTFYNIDSTNGVAATLNANGLRVVRGGVYGGSTSDLNNFVFLSTQDFGNNVTVNNHAATDWRLLINNKFGVDKTGHLYATNAEISGKITVASGSNVYTTDNTNPLNIGGENLALQTPSWANTNSYNAYCINLVENLVVGKTYTIQLWGVTFANTPTGGTIGVYRGSGSLSLISPLTIDSNGYACATFKVPAVTSGQENNALRPVIYLYNSPPNDSKTARSLTISRWKIEEGNKPTPWSPCYADMMGGNNLIPGTISPTIGSRNFIYGHWRASGGTVSQVSFSTYPIGGITKAIRVTNSTDAVARIGLCMDKVPDFKLNHYYTFSCWVKTSVDAKIYLQPIWTSNCNAGNSQDIYTVGNNWMFVSYTGKLTGTVPTDGICSAAYIYAKDMPVSAYLDVCGIKIEEGVRPTAWCPSIYDNSYRRESFVYSNFYSDSTSNATVTVNSAGTAITIKRTGATSTTKYGGYIDVPVERNTIYDIQFYQSATTGTQFTCAVGTDASGASIWTGLHGYIDVPTTAGRTSLRVTTLDTSTKMRIYIGSLTQNDSITISELTILGHDVSTAGTSATSYITQIDDGGIFVSPKNQTPTTSATGNSVKINGNGLYIYKGGVEQAYFTGTATAIGTTGQGRVIIKNDGLHVYDYVNNTQRDIAYFGNTARVGLSSGSRFMINAASLQAFDSIGAKYFEVSASGMTFGTNTAATTTQVSNAKGNFTILWNYENFTTANNGEAYICKLDALTNTPSDANGTVMWNGTNRTITKQMVNPNTIAPYNIPIYIVCRLSSATATTGTNYIVWYNSGWNYAALPTPSAVGGTWTWDNARDIILGKFVEPSSEGAFIDYEIYNPPLSSKQLTTVTTTAATAQSKADSVGNRDMAYRGCSDTAAGTAAKVVTCTNFPTLTKGLTVTVYSSTANTVTGAITLNVNSTGAKTIYANGAATSATNRLYWNAGSSLTFIYDGTYWRLEQDLSGNRFAHVGQSSNTTNVTDKPWFKVGSLLANAANVDYYITFHVEYYPDNQRNGKLRVRVRTDGNRKIAPTSCSINWISLSDQMSQHLDDFVLAYKADTADSIIELWAKVNANWGSYNFRVEDESTRTNAGLINWQLYNTTTDGGSAAITSGYTQIKSQSTVAYITFTTKEDGIKVHNAGDVTDFVQVNATDISMWRANKKMMSLNDSTLTFFNNSGGTVATYGSSVTLASNGATVTIGQMAADKYNAYITTSNFQIRNNTTAIATFGSSISLASNGATVTIGKVAASNYNAYITTSNFQIRNNTTAIATFGSSISLGSNGATVTIGQVAADKYNAYITTSNFQIRNNTTAIATFGSSISLGSNGATVTIGKVAASNYNAYITTSGFSVRNNTTAIATFGSSISLASNGATVTIGKTGSNGTYNTVISSTGLKVNDNTTPVAQFGTTVVIGKVSTRHIEIKDGGLQIYKDATAIMGHFGYGPGVNALGGTVSDAYFTLGTRTDSSGIGNYSIAEGFDVTASGYCSHAEGRETIAIGSYSHAEGYKTTARHDYSHAEGRETEASNTGHAEGYKTYAYGPGGHAEGQETKAISKYSHAEGYKTKAGQGGHAEGNETYASGDYSHAEGYLTTANGDYSHTGGWGTIADENGMTVVGKFNKSTRRGDLFIVGTGTSDTDRKNGFIVSGGGIIGIGDVPNTFRITTSVVATSNLPAWGYQSNTHPLRMDTLGSTIQYYYPIGIIGWNSSTRYLCLTRCCLTNRTTGSCTLSYMMYNASSSSRTGEITIEVLWVRTTK